jgi:uncharacterized membrane protein
MDIKDKAIDICLRPIEVWPEIKQERSGVRELYESYAAILAGMPAAAHFIGITVVGISFLGTRYRAPFLPALGYAVLSYCFSLAGLYLFALAAFGLAPRFGSRHSFLNAMKLGVYSSTPCWIGGILFVVPALMPVAILLSLYGIYLLYLGLPVLMETPVERRPLYLAALVAVGVAISAIACLLPASFFPQGRMGTV